ncbi:MAG: ABC transporter ATP-binding protein [Inconstantimicrobium porci]|uniref:ABC transporter ATP-binding protein n=1 Tax=Inconstantimicrobium porci TaxID=2652291 RepID=A0A7X2MX51_9CLOT|nr:ABC transporter ATP-binding protein [Inconstantimicrobium porci]MDD6770133.1 ABC transporter ATP-binding protein [Inconstantimicrobium porci]MDY5911292.1 ABC transporter ATP-binding protein [Inconstantimicrobium porci]MSR90718.1 ABC transporter ATP-binding protein [Inconstantimicrobium porci]
MPLIKLQNISKVYGKNDYKTEALKNISLNIDKGEYLAIMGPSGSGKSTLLNIIGCMDNQTSGKYYLKDNDISLMNNKELSIIRNQSISFIFQHFALMKDYTIYDNVELPLSFRKITKRKKKGLVMNCLKELHIEEQYKKKPNQLSGGQQQRAAIARALCSDAKIILADEPTGALDQKTGKDIMNILTKLNNQGKTIIIITHDPLIASYCKRILTIKDGQIISDIINEHIHQ